MLTTDNTLTREEFNQVISESVHLGQCLCGWGGGEIRIMIPWYGKNGLFITCPHCSRSTKLFDISETFFAEDNAIGTPITCNAITQSLKLAAVCWNNHEVGFYNNHRRKS